MRTILLSCLLTIPAAFAGGPWTAPANQWSEADARRILSDSPWAKPLGRDKAYVRWESSRPVRIAMARLGDKVVTEDLQHYFVVTVVGVAGADKAEATLKANGREAVKAVGRQRGDGSVVFLFPREARVYDPTTFAFPLAGKLGNSVEFRVTVGGQALKQSFPLKHMKYGGQTEL
jgi:hypothetical protein